MTIKFEGNTLYVSGAVTFETVSALVAESRKILAQASGGLLFDLSGVDKANSAALAYFLDCKRFAAKKGVAIQFVNASERLTNIASVCGVKEMLNLSGS